MSQLVLHEKCPYSELLWSAFSRIWTEYGEILRISPYSAQFWQNEINCKQSEDQILIFGTAMIESE